MGKAVGLILRAVLQPQTGIYFKSGSTTPITPTWQPHWYLSFSGEAGITAQCIQHVQTLWKQDKHQAHLIDENMTRSVTQAKKALTTQNNTTALAEAIQTASDCFHAWGLINQPLKTHMDALLEAGALAVKPTGIWRWRLCVKSLGNTSLFLRFCSH